MIADTEDTVGDDRKTRVDDSCALTVVEKDDAATKTEHRPIEKVVTTSESVSESKDNLAKEAPAKAPSSGESTSVEAKDESDEATEAKPEPFPMDSKITSEDARQETTFLKTGDVADAEAKTEAEGCVGHDEEASGASTGYQGKEGAGLAEDSYTPNPTPAIAEPVSSNVTAANASEAAHAVIPAVSVTTIDNAPKNTNPAKTICKSPASTSTITTTTNEDAAASTATCSPQTATNPRSTVCSRSLSSGLLLAAFVSACMAHIYVAALLLGVGALGFSLAVFRVDLSNRKVLVRIGAGGTVVAGLLVMRPAVVSLLMSDLLACARNFIAGE